MYIPEQLSLLFIAAIILLIPRLRATYFAEPAADAQQPRDRDSFLDIAKAVAIVAVIIIHVGYFFITQEPETIPETIRIVNNLLRFAIPWFLIVTGAVLPTTISKGRYLAIIVPYTLATIAIGIARQAGPKTTLIWLATGRASIPYYYILVLIQCYFLYPFLLRIRGKQWFLPAMFAVTLFSFLFSSTWYIYGFPFIGPYLFFFCYGMAFRPLIRSRTPLPLRDVLTWCAIALLASIFLIAVPTLTYNTSLFYGVAFFWLFLSAESSIKKMPFIRFFSPIGQSTLWIFLTHMFIVEWVYQITRQIAAPDGIRYAATLTIAFLASIILGHLIHKFYVAIRNRF